MLVLVEREESHSRNRGHLVPVSLQQWAVRVVRLQASPELAEVQGATEGPLLMGAVRVVRKQYLPPQVGARQEPRGMLGGTVQILFLVARVAVVAVGLTIRTHQTQEATEEIMAGEAGEAVAYVVIVVELDRTPTARVVTALLASHV